MKLFGMYLSPFECGERVLRQRANFNLLGLVNNASTPTPVSCLFLIILLAGIKKYWDDRYDADGMGDEPFDWMCGWKQLSETVAPLIDDKNARILMIGCGNAPLSSDFWDAGYKNQINIDYSEVVIKQQKDRFPHMEWVVMDALNMTFEDGEVRNDTCGKVCCIM